MILLVGVGILGGTLPLFPRLTDHVCDAVGYFLGKEESVTFGRWSIITSSSTFCKGETNV